jgi:hypothetical protein
MRDQQPGRMVVFPPAGVGSATAFMPSDLDQFAALRLEFEALRERLQESRELCERRLILDRVRQVIRQVDVLLQARQSELDKKLRGLRKGF